MLCFRKRIPTTIFVLFILILLQNEADGAMLRHRIDKKEVENLTVRRRLNSLSEPFVMDRLLKKASTVREDYDALLAYEEEELRLGVTLELDDVVDEGDDGKKGKGKDKDKDKDKNKGDSEKHPINSGESEIRIIGGDTAEKPYNFFTMLLDYRVVNGYGRFYWSGCGATLVAPDMLLTAAHCVVDREHKIDYAYVNAYAPWLGNDSNNYELIQITEHIVHEDYQNVKSPPHDIALLKLASPVTKFFPIKLPRTTAPYNFTHSDDLTIMGFGYTAYPGVTPTPTFLQEANVKFMPNAKCKSLYHNANITELAIDDSMLCAYTENYDVDACQGDSGGPIIMKDSDGERDGFLVGVTSWGYGCAKKGFPGVYADIRKHLSWIHDLVCEDIEDRCDGSFTKEHCDDLSDFCTETTFSLPTSLPSSLPTSLLSSLPTPLSTSPPPTPLSTSPPPTPLSTPSPTSYPTTLSPEPDHSKEMECKDSEGEFIISIRKNTEIQDCSWRRVKHLCDYKASFNSKRVKLKDICPEACDNCP